MLVFFISARKAIYPASVGEMFTPVRESGETNWKLCAVHFENSIKSAGESTMYATDCVKFDRHGFKQRDRVILLTTQHLYFLEAKEQRFQKKQVYALKDVTKITMSSNRDSVVIISAVTTNPKTNESVKDDFVFQLPNLVEFVTKFVGITKREDALEIVANGEKCSLAAGGSNGSHVLFGIGQPSILSVKKTLSVVAPA